MTQNLTGHFVNNHGVCIVTSLQVQKQVIVGRLMAGYVFETNSNNLIGGNVKLFIPELWL